MYEYRVEVDRIIDGDTVDFIFDLGFDIKKKARCRLYGINAPESRTRDLEEKEKGLAAKDWLIKRLTDAEIMVCTKKGTGKYGRWLAEILVKEPENGWTNINKEMVKKRLAVEYYGGKREG